MQVRMNPWRTDKTGHYPYYGVFLSGVLLYLIAVLPFLIYHGGIFFYYGDYNVQQVPFYILAGRAVREGNFFWNSKVDLGASMGGAFAFYLWGSPFFWLSTLFPEKAVPYLLPFLMSLKYGTAAAAAYAYARTLTRTERGALLAAFLYAFSGLQAVNIVFQHMHDATAFFPLYLLTFDRFVSGKTGRTSARPSAAGAETHPSAAGSGSTKPASFLSCRLPFVLMTALSAVVNYYFFYGQVIFIILYYCVRYVVGQHRPAAAVIREIALLLLHGVLGLLLVSFFLIQVVDILQGNSRLGDTIAGYDMVAYSEPTTPLAILKSMFFIPDNVGRGTLFTSEQIRNSSLSAYLPGFAMAGVIGYLHARRRRSWLRRLVIVIAVIVFVPVLNAVFSAFNNEYYARWFYMPLLFLAIITVRELEAADTKGLRLGLRVNWFAWVLCIAISLLPSRSEDGVMEAFHLLEYPRMFVVQVIVTGVCLCLSTYLILFPAGMRCALQEPVPWKHEVPDPDRPLPSGAHRLRRFENNAPLGSSLTGSVAGKTGRVGAGGRNGLLTTRAMVLSLAVCVLSTMGVLFNGTSIIARSGGVKWQQQLLDNKPVLPASSTDGHWFRVETDGTSTNYEMVWGYPTIHCFESTVTPSIVSFYKGIGINRTVDSKMNFSHVGARFLLSQRYYLDNAIIHQDQNYEDKGGLPGFTAAGESDGYHLYENHHFIPMGFTFDSYITEEDYEQIDSDRQKDRLLVVSLILDDEAAASSDHLLQRISRHDAENLTLSDSEFLAAADQRAATACTDFAFDQSGFHATTAELSEENLVFFSVPWDKGWTAFVDGQETPILKADYGLMAIDVPAGVHEITFTYLPWGFRPAVACSAAAAAFILVLTLGSLIASRRR